MIWKEDHLWSSCYPYIFHHVSICFHMFHHVSIFFKYVFTMNFLISHIFQCLFHHLFPHFFTILPVSGCPFQPRQRGGGAALGEVPQGQTGRHRGKSPKDPAAHWEHDHGKARGDADGEHWWNGWGNDEKWWNMMKNDETWWLMMKNDG